MFYTCIIRCSNGPSCPHSFAPWCCAHAALSIRCSNMHCDLDMVLQYQTMVP